jgi:nucleotide-binding universal stress UspA family protein
MMATGLTREGEDGAGPELERVVCGVDSSEQSRAVPGQAQAVADQGAQLHAVSVWDPVLATRGDIALAPIDQASREACDSALSWVAEEHPEFSTSLVLGGVVPGLLMSAAENSADLLAVASHGNSRAAGVLFGSAATTVLRHAPCSVLITRDERPGFPGPILHAGDGSPDALDAAAVAARIAARHGVPVTTISIGDGPWCEDAVAQSNEVFARAGVEVNSIAENGSPHRGIVSAAAREKTGLIVIGSRGRTGLAGIGSVSEKVAHRAPCPVLVVRRKSHPRIES